MTLDAEGGPADQGQGGGVWVERPGSPEVTPLGADATRAVANVPVSCGGTPCG